MKKKIILKNMSVSGMTDKTIFQRKLKDMNFTLTNNEIVSFVSETNIERSTLINVLTNQEKINEGSVLFEGEYYDFDVEFPNNRIATITSKMIKKAEGSNKTIQSYLNEGIKNKTKLRRVYKNKLRDLHIELDETKELLKYISKPKHFIKYNNELKKEKYQEINSFDLSHLRKQTDHFNELDSLKSNIINISEEINTLKMLRDDKVDYVISLSNGKHKKIERNSKNIISEVNKYHKEERTQLKTTVYKSKPNEEQLEKINERLKRETENFIKFVKNIKAPGYTLSPKINGLLKKLSTPKDDATFSILFDSLVSLLKGMKSFMNADINYQIDKRLNYIESIKDHKSALNSDIFNEIFVKITQSLKTKILYYNAVIKDVDLSIDRFVARDKIEKSISKRKLWEFNLISLKFQKQIFAEKIDIVKKYSDEINNEALNHDLKNIDAFYEKILEFENTMQLVDISLNDWRLKRDIKGIILKEEIEIIDHNENKEKMSEQIKVLNDKKYNREIYDLSVVASAQEFINNGRKVFNSSIKEMQRETILELKNKKEKIKGEIDKINSTILFKDKDDKELEMTYLLDELSFNTDLLDHQLSSMSKSELQKLSIVKSVLEGTEIIIIESPEVDLAAEAKTSIATAIKNIAKSNDVMFIVTTKNIKNAVSYSDRIALISSGYIVEYGNTKEIVKNPKHSFTKEMFRNAEKISFLTDETNFSGNIIGGNLFHNAFTYLKLRKISKTHNVLSSTEEFERWN